MMCEPFLRWKNSSGPRRYPSTTRSFSFLRSERNQYCYGFLNGFLSSSIDSGSVGARNWMFDHRKRMVWYALNPCHQFSGVCKGRRHDTDRGHPIAFCHNSVVQTARRAATSVTHSTQNRIPSHYLGHQVDFCGSAVIQLRPADDLRDSVTLTQD